MKSKFRFLVLIIAVSFSGIAYAADDLKIYSETGEETTKLSFSALKETLFKVSDHNQFFPYITESKIMEKSSEKVWVIYQKLFFPWPLKDRDSLCQWEIKSEAKKIRIKFYDVKRPDILREKDNIMRVPYSRGYWMIEDLGDLRKVTYHAKGNPGGHIPHVLASLFSGSQGPKIVKALIERAKQQNSIETK